MIKFVLSVGHALNASDTTDKSGLNFVILGLRIVLIEVDCCVIGAWEATLILNNRFGSLN